ncbi:adenosylcobinamide-GDP ribazoletransferase [Bacillus ndiopicus]|uniref:adenosylcobinamide-GDP ribazoletransferase n=1 Tax=Bacillus ndiopicus TaxID=1347368 RepID=UPI0005AB065D|nr:adenosylcobinamide-GDP ribazoletransferase [Bacillus ndiopicus]
MKHFVTGLLLCLQFFSALPVKRELSLTTKDVTAMYMLMPLLSLLTGATSLGFLAINNYWLELSPLLAAIILVVTMIGVTGGIHTDGFIDTSDAFFSYRDQEKRLTILEDPRVGAFGVLAVVCFLLLKVGFLYEALLREVNIFYFIAIPLLSRVAMLLYFITMKSAKTSGLAAYFKERVQAKGVIIACIIYSLLVIGYAVYVGEWSLLALYGIMLIALFYYRHWSNKNFAGMTGDLLGAFYEGTELILWGTLLLFI